MQQVDALGTLTEAGPRRITVVASTQDIDREGDCVVTAGIDYSAYMRTGSVLFSHDPNQPIARCISITRGPESLTATIEFPAEGKVKNSDRVYSMVKEHVLNAVSIGFLPKESAPIDPKNPRKGMRITKSELLEISLVSIPANAAALITHRAAQVSRRTVARSMPLAELNRRRALVAAGLDPDEASTRSKRQREADLIALGIDLDAPPRTPEQRRAAERAARLAEIAEGEAKSQALVARIVQLQAVFHRTPEQLRLICLGVRPPNVVLTAAEERSIASRHRLSLGLIPGSKAERAEELRDLGII